jgi:hypothetical protein
MTAYTYRGSLGTDERYKGQRCEAIRRPRDGKCIRGRNGNMLVRFGDTPVVVDARQLRKVQP